MSDQKIVSKRIPDANLVGSGPMVICDDDPDIILYDLSKVIVKKCGQISSANYIAQPPIINSGILGLISQSANTATQNSLEYSLQNFDTVGLTDIENISYEQYYDQVSKLVKYKAILKIRNTASDKNNVSGVDARVYNPNA